MENIIKYEKPDFESIKHINEYGAEYWSARELMPLLGYQRWENFEKVIEKAIVSISNAQTDLNYWLREVTKSKITGKNTETNIKDYELSRFACYVIAQNGDSKKSEIAAAQTYFAVQTRKQELHEEFEDLTEDQKRLAIRGELKSHNKSLAEAAQNAGVTTSQEFATFQNYGYMGLYGGLTAQGIKKRKGLKKGQNILDHMGSTELAANLFRATQTDEKLRRDNIQGKNEANKTHYVVGKKVRQTIAELGGTMPEDLPTPGKSIKQIEKEQKASITNLDDKK